MSFCIPLQFQRFLLFGLFPYLIYHQWILCKHLMSPPLITMYKWDTKLPYSGAKCQSIQALLPGNCCQCFSNKLIKFLYRYGHSYMDILMWTYLYIFHKNSICIFSSNESTQVADNTTYRYIRLNHFISSFLNYARVLN